MTAAGAFDRRRGGSSAGRVGRVPETSTATASVPAGVPSSYVAAAARRRWTINGDFLALQATGVARYAREVSLALDALVAEGHPLSRDLEIDMVAPREAQEPLRAIKVRVVPEFAKPRLPQFWVQVQLPRHVRGGLLSFCNLAPIVVRRHIVCIHDLHTRLAPDSYSFPFRLAHRLILPILGRRAVRLTTVSSLSREHLARFNIAEPEKVTVTYNGTEHARRWDAARSELQVASRRPFVLCIGRSQKYKNIELVLRTAPMLDRVGLDVWIAGDLDNAILQPEGSVTAPNIRILGRISDDDLAKVMSEAVCLLFPSRIEGFGLPAVEAMTRGCPVVVSTSPCLPEICGDAALYADPDDPSAWVSAIYRLQTNANMRQQLIERGHARALVYSWRSIAEAYLRLMAEVDADARGRRLPAGSWEARSW